MNDRTFKILSERDMISSSMLANADVQEKSVFNAILSSDGLQEELLEENNDINEDITNQSTRTNGIDYPSLIEFVTGSLLRHTDNSNSCKEISEHILMEEDRREMISMDTFSIVKN